MMEGLISGISQTYGQISGYGIIMALLVFALLWLKLPAERRILFNTLLFYLFCLLGIAGSGVAAYLGFADTASILYEIFILCQGLALIRLAGVFIFSLALPQLNLSTPSILQDILVIVAYFVWGMIRLHYGGLDLSGIVTTSAVITAVIAFSMQDTLGNILGGIALQLDNSIELDDWIKVDDVVGRVVDIGWRSTLIETRNWETVVVPNSFLMKGKFSVLGRRTGQPTQWRRWIWFVVDYSVPPAKVIAVAQQAIRHADIPNVAHHPEPNCVLMEFADSACSYALRYWLTDLAVDDPTDSSVRVHIEAALAREGISIAYPRQFVHLIKESEKLSEQRAQRDKHQRIEMLRGLEMFSMLNDDEFQTLAESLYYSPFIAGDRVTHQGSVAHWLYIVVSGTVSVRLRGEDGKEHQVSSISAEQGGFVVGEMGLITGEPRTATVIATSDVVCYRLEKPAFEEILRARPAIAEDLSRLMASRQAGLENARQDMNAKKQSTVQGNSQEILRKIRKFFALSSS
jgi:small-conductance mechanosensitive channel/CRP-like cAMP-binding protein